MAVDPSVAVIILNWNGFEDTVACLQSFQLATYSNYRIVIVDNGSKNDEGRRICQRFPKLHLIQNPVNRGFAGGSNDGIRWALQAGFDYVVCLNNDCIVEPDWLKRLVDGIRFSDAHFASSRIMYYPETHLICSDEDLLRPDGSGLVLNRLKVSDERKGIRPIFGASGAASIYSAACLESVKILGDQYFDELFFAYLEDIDLGIRLNVRGFKGISVPDAVVYHKEAQTSGYRTPFQIFHLEKNRILVELLNYPMWMVPVGEFFYSVKTLLRMCDDYAGKNQRPHHMGKVTGSNDRLGLIVDSRLWVLKNLPVIWQHRKDRINRGLIDRKVHRFFVWKFSEH